MLVAAASTSVVFAAFCWAVQLPKYHQRQNVYFDNDGEARPAKHQDAHDRTARILVVIFTLATLLLSAGNWIAQNRNAGLGIITIAWVLRHSRHTSTCLIESADNHRCRVLFACATVSREATTVLHRSADSCLIARIIAWPVNYYFQGISRSIHILVSSCPWHRPCLHMLFSTTASHCVS